MSTPTEQPTPIPAQPRLRRRRRALWLGALSAIGAGVAAALTFGLLPSSEPVPQTPLFLERQLGVQLTAAPVVRRPVQGVKVELGKKSGFSLQVGKERASIASADTSGHGWRAHAGGAIRATGFGSESVLVTKKNTEQFLTVTSHRGVKTWEWQLDSSIGRPRVGDDGYVAFIDAVGAVRQDILVLPPQILDTAGRRITPPETRWSLAQNGSGKWLLQLRLDDRALPVPYVIDPALEAGSTGTGSGSVSANTGSSTTIVSTTIPGGVVSGDLLVMSGAFRMNTNTTTALTLSAPTGGGTWRAARGTTQLASSPNAYMRIWFNQYTGTGGPIVNKVTQSSGSVQVIDGATQVAAFTGVAASLVQMDMNENTGYSAAGATSASLASTVTTMTDHALVIHAAAVNDEPTTLAAPSGMTAANAFNSSPGTNKVSNLLSYTLDATPSGNANEVGNSATGPQTLTATTSGGSPTDYLSMVVAFRPNDTTVPVISSAVTNAAGTTLTLTYTEAGGSSGASGFNKSIVPDPSRFTVHSSGASDQTPTSVTIGGTATTPTVVLGGLALESGRTITVDYTKASFTKNAGAFAISTAPFSLTATATITGFAASGNMSVAIKHSFSANTGVGTFSYASFASTSFATVQQTPTSYQNSGFTIEASAAISQGLQDLNGNQAANLSGNAVTNNVNLSAPVVSSVTTTAGAGTSYFKAADVVTIEVNFDKAVDVVTTGGTPTLALNTSPARSASCAAQTNVTAVVCTYTVQAGDTAADLDYTGTGSLVLNSGTIKMNASSTDATLTLPAPTTFDTKTLVVDTTNPTISSVALASVSPAAGANNGQAAAFKSGNTVYYRATTGAANSFQLAVTGADTTAGLKDGSFPALGGTVGSWTHTAQSNVAQSGNVVTSTNDFAWTDGESASPTEALTVRDNALNTSATTTLTYTADATAPSTTDDAASLTPRNSGTTVTLTPTDGGAGVAATFYTTDGSTPAIDAGGTPTGTTASGTSVTIPDVGGSYTVKYFSVDNVGNKESVKTATTIVVDKSGPAVTDVSSDTANGTYGTSPPTIDVKVTFDEAVTVVTTGGTPSIALNTTPSRSATYASGSGTTVLHFTYTVLTGDASADLNYAATTSLVLNGGTMQDALGNNAPRTLPATGAAGSLGTNKNIVILTAPTVTSVSSSTANGAYKAGQAVNVSIDFNTAVTVTGTPQIQLETGTIDRLANCTAATPVTTVSCTYTVVAGDTSSDLDFKATDSLALNGGTIVDATTSTEALLTLPTVGGASSIAGQKAIVIDTTDPTGSISYTSGYYTSLAAGVAISPSSADVGGSGVASAQVQRRSATLSAGSCGSPGSYADVSLVGGAHTSGSTPALADATCTEYQLVVTDNAGNVATISPSGTPVAKIDSTLPTNVFSLTSVGTVGGLPVAYYPGSGTNIFFRGTNGSTLSKSFKLTATVTDTASGSASLTTSSFAGAGGVSHTAGSSVLPGSGVFDSAVFSFTDPAAGPNTVDVKTTDAAGNDSSTTSFTLRDDSTAPGGSPALTVNGGVAAGSPSTTYDGDGSFTIGTRTDYTEAASGTASGLASSTLARESAVLSGDTCLIFGAPSTVTGTDDQIGLTTGCYRYTLTGTDNVGNAASISTIVKVDTTAPSAPTLTLSAATGSFFLNATTAYFKGGVATGGFTVTDTGPAADAESGLNSSAYTFPAAFNGSWSRSGTGNARDYSITGATSTSATAQTVKAQNNAGLDSTGTTFDVVADSTAPTGGAVTVNSSAAAGSPTTTYNNTGSFTIASRTEYAETQTASASGLASTVLTRESATLSSDACGGFGSSTTVTGTTLQDGAAGIATGNCYRYTLTGTDNVGNAASISTIVKVDTTAPTSTTAALSAATGAAFINGTTAYYRSTATSGGFTVTGTAADADSGIASVTFPATLAADWSTSGAGTTSGSTRTYSFSGATPAAPGAQSITATNNAGGTANAGFTVTDDTGAPTAAGTPLAYSSYSGGVTPVTNPGIVVTAGSDGGSGYSGWSLVRDYAAFSSGTTCGTFPGTYAVTVTTGATGTTVTDDLTLGGTHSGSGNGCYRYRLIDTDNVGNTTSTNLTTFDYRLKQSGLVTFGTTGTVFQSGAGAGVFVKGASTFSLKHEQGDLTGVDFPETATGTTGGLAIAGTYSGGSAAGTLSGGFYESPSPQPTYSVDGFTGPATITATLNPGPGSSTTAVTVKADTSAPTGGAVVANGSGSTTVLNALTIPLSVTNFGDGGGSGIKATGGNVLTRQVAALANGSCGGFGGTVTITLPASTDSSGIASGNCYQYTLAGTDNVDNIATPVQSAIVKVDTGTPGTPTFTFSTTGSAFWPGSGSTAYFNPAPTASGSVQVTAASTSAAGIASYAFPASLGTNWTTSGSDPSRTYTFAAAADTATPGAQTATATGNNSLTSGAGTFTISADSTAPATTDNTGTITNAWRTSATVTLSPADTGGSGVAQTYYTTDGSTPTTSSSTGTSIVLSTEGTYTIKYFSVDNVGNTESFVTGAAQIRLDTTAPATPGLSAITTPSQNGASLTLTGVVTDTGGSDGVSVSYLYCAGSGQDVATCSATTIGSSSTSAGGYAVTWSSQPADGPYTVFARATDAAGNVSAASTAQTITVDNNAPVISVASGPSNPTSSTSATFTFTTNEPSAPFECNLDGGGFSSCTNPVTFTPLSSGAHTFQVRARDGANNLSNTVTYPSWTIDTVAPSGTFAPASTLSGTVALTATATDAGGVGVQDVQFQYSTSDTGPWTNIGTADTSSPYAASWATGPANSVPNGTYFLQAVARDLANNSAAATAPVSVTVSNTPKALLTATIGTAGTPLALQYNGQIDTGSTPPTSAFTVIVAGSSRTVTGVTFGFDTVYLALATPVVAAETVTVSYTVPSGPAVPLKDILGFNLAALSGQGVGNSSTFGLAPPVLASSTPADGSLLTSTGLAVGTITFTADKIVTWSNISFTVPGGAPAAPAFTAPVGTTATATYGSTVPGEYQFTATLNDGVNAAVNIAAHFTIPAPTGAVNPPATSKTGNATTSGNLQSSDGTGNLSWQAGTFANNVVVSVTPVVSAATPAASRPATTFGLSSAITTGAIDVTVTNLSDGSRITSFPAANPLEIIFENGTDDSAPVTSSDGGQTYRDIPRIPGPGLPAGYIDGYWFDATTRKLHILTTHLSIFAVVRDVTAPSAPRSLSGVIAGDGLTLRWEPASDNSGSIAHYHLFVNGERVQTYGGVTYEAKLGPYTPGDTRVFQVRADDSRLNLGPSSSAVTLLPDVTGQTPAAARSVLVRSGLSIGTTTTVSSTSPAGTIVRTVPAYPGVVVVGGTVGVEVSDGRGGQAAGGPLLLKVAGAKRVSLKQRKTVALRVLVSVPAKATITMRSTRGAAIASWTRTLRAGATIVRVNLPKAAQRTGKYSFTVAARATSAPASKVVARTTVVRFTPAPAPAGKKVDVVLVNGPAVTRGGSLTLPSSTKVQSVTQAPDIYDVSGGAAANVQVVVVDLDTKGIDAVHFIRNLRAVYPDLRIVALASTPAQVDQARQWGATIVLTKPVSVEILSSVVTDLIPTTTPETRATAAQKAKTSDKKRIAAPAKKSAATADRPVAAAAAPRRLAGS